MSEPSLPRRDSWSSRPVFLIAAVGSAVGLGNVWRFPYLVFENGGGSFLIPYIVALFLVGIPLLILELALGQFTRRGVVGALRSLNWRTRGVGFLHLFSVVWVSLYYSAILSWTVLYCFRSFGDLDPWIRDPEGFFRNEVLQADDVDELGSFPLPRGISWVLLQCLAFVWMILFLCVWKGVKSIGKVMAVASPLPILLLLVLLVRGLTLEGAWDGINFYLRPDFGKLLSPEIWLAAASQIFFSIGLATGIMPCYASHNDPRQDLVKDNLIISLCNSGISVLAGFVVFSVLGHIALETGRTVPEVATSGPGLAFVVFPQALALMPLPNLFALLFFLMLFCLGISSAASLANAVISAVCDERTARAKPQRRGLVSLAVCSLGFLLSSIFVSGKGLYYVDIADHYVSNYLLVLGGISEALALGWTKIQPTSGAASAPLPPLRGVVFLWTKICDATPRRRDSKMLRYGWIPIVTVVVTIFLAIVLALSLVRDLTRAYGGYPYLFQSIGFSLPLIGLVLIFYGCVFGPDKCGRISGGGGEGGEFELLEVDEEREEREEREEE